MDNIRLWPTCAMHDCDNDAVNGDRFCDYHLPMIERAYEIEHAPHAAELAGDAARLRWGVDVQPPQRPEDDGRWA